MGKTHKDQHKYDRKHRREDNDIARTPRKPKHRPYDEIIPEGDELDPYEELDYDDEYYR